MFPALTSLKPNMQKRSGDPDLNWACTFDEGDKMHIMSTNKEICHVICSMHEQIYSFYLSKSNLKTCVVLLPIFGVSLTTERSNSVLDQQNVTEIQ